MQIAYRLKSREKFKQWHSFFKLSRDESLVSRDGEGGNLLLGGTVSNSLLVTCTCVSDNY